MGKPRFSECGFQVPLSTLSNGFDQPNYNSISALAAYNGMLYASLSASNTNTALSGQLWHSHNGDEWQQIQDAQLASDIRLMLATPWGLLVAGKTNVNHENPTACCWLLT